MIQVPRHCNRDCMTYTLQEDFECDFGYARSNGTCQPIPGISDKDCDQIASGNYYVSESHLRLVHNDSCLHVDRVVTDSDGHGTCVGPNCSNSGGKSRGALGKFFIFLLVSRQAMAQRPLPYIADIDKPSCMWVICISKFW